MEGWTTGADEWGQGAAPDAGAVPRLNPLTLGDILDGMFRLLLANWRVYLVALGVIVIPFNVVAGWLSTAAVGGVGFWADMIRNPMAPPAAAPAQPSATLGVSYFVLQFLSTFVVTPITWGLATHLAVGAYERRELTVGGVWRATMRRFWALLGILVLLGLIFFGMMFGGGLLIGGVAAFAPVAVAVVIGLLVLCVVAWLAVKVSLPVPALVAEGVGPAAALGRSWALTTGRFWRTLGTLVVMFLILLVLSLVFIAGFALVGALFGTTGAIVAGIIGSFVVGMLTTPLTFNALTLLYYDSRIRGEAYDLDVRSQQVAYSPPAGPGAPPTTHPPFG